MHRLGDLLAKMKSSSGFLFVIILTFIYFSFYAVKGERGFMRYVYLTGEVSEARRMSEKYAREKSDWEERVRLLSAESLDLDMLDEQARLVLNMVGSDEFVILDDSEQ